MLPIRRALVALLLCTWCMAGLAYAQTGSAAKVVEAQGSVSLFRDNQEWVLFPGDPVQLGQTIITGPDGFATLEVSDGSSFLVYPDSKVVFRKNPGSLRDLIDVFLGRVKVHINRLGGEPNPTRVYTPTAVISVRGTTFEVSVDESEVTTVFVVEGTVGVRHQLLPSSRETVLEAGQSLVVDPLVPLAKAGVDGAGIANAAEDVVRVAASLWRRIGRGSSGGGGGAPGAGGGTTPPLPTDEKAPAPPPPPPQ
ncbi:MAG: FecR family protein [Acidobacteria bacterium]|nr:FecR family protein [Acidobacteriota bacterium]MDA1236426.1 FecR family protein [Acidobacteriota bacterium]